MDELIRKKDALDALMAEREHLLANGQKGAEHILTHHGYNVIDELQPVQSDVPVINVGDMISRQAATTIPVMPKEHRHYQTNNLDDAYEQGWNDLQECIENLPPVQPTITHEQAIDYLHKTGWLQNHDRILTESKIVPSAQPDVPDTNVEDMISRQAAYDACDTIATEFHVRGRLDEEYAASMCAERIETLPPVQTEIIHCKDCLYKKIRSWKNQGATFCSFGERDKKK